LQKRPELEISVVEVTGNIGLMRLNALHPPFDNPAIRRALLPALDQAMFMNAIAGDQSKYWRDQVGYFAPDTPMASSVGMEALAGPRSADRARQLLQEAGYKGERVVPLSPGDYPRIAALSLVAADMLTRCGMNVNVQTIDWDSVIRRRASKAKPEDGGWSVFFTTFTGADLANPASEPALRGDGTSDWFGWPTAPKLETLRADWLAATDEAQRKAIAASIQAQAFGRALPAVGTILPADRALAPPDRRPDGDAAVLEHQPQLMPEANQARVRSRRGWIRALEAVAAMRRDPALILPGLLPDLAARFGDRPALAETQPAAATRDDNVTDRAHYPSCRLRIGAAELAGRGDGKVRHLAQHRRHLVRRQRGAAGREHLVPHLIE